MAEYIERERLLRDVRIIGNQPWSEWETAGVIDVINKQPAADVAPVKHGKWIEKQLDNFRKYQVTCSNCGWVGIENYDSYNDPSDFNYCPNCGAKMDLED